MPEPLTIAAVGAIVLTEGIKFLYGQATEVLKRWRDRKEAAAKGDTAAAEAAARVTLESPPIVEGKPLIEGRLAPPVIDFEVVERSAETLGDLRRGLAPYADVVDPKPIDAQNEQLTETADAVRQLLEAVYRQRITFQGEQRPASGPVVEGELKVDQVLGDAAAVRARVIASGYVLGRVQAGTVGPGGRISAVDADTIGGAPP